MNIDWSKAPEGATHYSPKLIDDDMWSAVFWRVENNVGVEAWQIDNDTGGLNHFSRPTWRADTLKRMIARPQEWTGTGLPPVGTVCEGSMPAWGEYRKDWKKCRVIAHENGSAVVIRHETVLGWCDTFRPISTQEQIEAEERENAVDDMYETVGNIEIIPTWRDALFALYDAGYRKQPKEGA